MGPRGARAAGDPARAGRDDQHRPPLAFVADAGSVRNPHLLRKRRELAPLRCAALGEKRHVAEQLGPPGHLDPPPAVLRRAPALRREEMQAAVGIPRSPSRRR